MANKVEKEIEVKDLFTLSEVIESVKETFPGLVHMRIPTCNSASPTETDFDTLVETLVGTAINCPVIISDQVGLSRATTGCVAACIFKEFQISASFEGLVETVPGMNQDLLKMDRYSMDMNKDALFRGEFEVIKQLRENIAESKLSYEIMDDAAQVFLKSKIMDNIHKYFYMIAFTAYMRESAETAMNAATEEDKIKNGLTGGKISTPADQLKLAKIFSDYMKEHANLATIVEEGKGKLQWERDIPAAALSNLESLASTDFKANLGKIIHDIYQTAHYVSLTCPRVITKSE